MRYIAVSVLSFFVVLPVFADARLPVVNLASAGVSARAAFGEPIVTMTPDVQKKSVVVSDAAPQKSEPQTQSVARAATPRVATTVHDNAADLGGQIIASADVLSPRRPSSDLWAHSSNTSVAPLRLPSPDEFSVIRSDDVLPEESLNNPAPVRVADATQSVSQMSELDAQIALLNELQRRAEASVAPNIARNDAVVKNTDARSVAPRRVVARPNVSRAATAQKIARNDIVSAKDEDVKLSRMVVPMDDMNDDVVVRAVKRAESPRIAAVRDDMTKMTPSELRKAFRKTFLSENKHLSTFQIDDRFDVASDMTADAVGFTSERTLSEAGGGIRPLEIKIKFRNEDAALSRDNYNLLTEYAGIVLGNPTRAVQVSIPQSVVNDADGRKLAARRLAIIEQVLRDNGISEQRILPVLAARDEADGLLLRMISLEQYETLTKKQRDIFGDTVSKKTYRSMSW